MNKLWNGALVLIAVLLLAGTPAAAQTNEELLAEIEALKQGQKEMAKDVAAIKEILEELRPKKPKPFEPTDISLKGAPVMGDADAKVTVVEFTDYQCPFCRRHKGQTLPKIREQYIESGKVRYALRQFPLTRIHPQAQKASEAALCAGGQGKYWELHERIFANQKKLSDADLVSYAEETGLDTVEFKKCLESGKYEEQVKEDLQAGAKGGVRGTPSFFLGLTDPDDPSKIRATRFLRGAQPFQAFQKAIEELLKGKPDGEKKVGGQSD